MSPPNFYSSFALFLTLFLIIAHPAESTVSCYECMAVGDRDCYTGRCVGQYCYKAISQGSVRKGCEYVQYQPGCQYREMYLFNSIPFRGTYCVCGSDYCNSSRNVKALGSMMIFGLIAAFILV